MPTVVLAVEFMSSCGCPQIDVASNKQTVLPVPDLLYRCTPNPILFTLSNRGAHRLAATAKRAAREACKVGIAVDSHKSKEPCWSTTALSIAALVLSFTMH